MDQEEKWEGAEHGKPGEQEARPETPAREVPGGPPAGPRPSQGAEPAGSMTANLIEVNDLTWERAVEKAAKPVAVMFYSPSCAFCHQMEPYFRAFAAEFSGSVIFVRLNILQSPWTAERYGVRSTPTFKFFCDGRPVQEMVGAVYPAILKRTVSEVLVHGKECAQHSTAIDYEITGYG